MSVTRTSPLHSCYFGNRKQQEEYKELHRNIVTIYNRKIWKIFSEWRRARQDSPPCKKSGGFAVRSVAFWRLVPRPRPCFEHRTSLVISQQSSRSIPLNLGMSAADFAAVFRYSILQFYAQSQQYTNLVFKIYIPCLTSRIYNTSVYANCIH
jgi:hypothetical protein